MKKLFALPVIGLMLLSCNEQNQNHNHKEADATAVEKQEQESGKEGLVLNNGQKWKADSNTNKNVKVLLAVLEKFTAGTDKTLKAYGNTAAALQDGLDKMISECRMKGPDHDALHQWLEPLIGEVAKLKQSATDAGAAGQMEKIDAQVKRYAQYFE